VISINIHDDGSSNLTEVGLLPHVYRPYVNAADDAKPDRIICDEPGCYDLWFSPIHIQPEVRTTKIIYEVTVRGRDGYAHALAEACSRAHATALERGQEAMLDLQRAGILISPPGQFRGDQVEYKIAFFVPEAGE